MEDQLLQFIIEGLATLIAMALVWLGAKFKISVDKKAAAEMVESAIDDAVILGYNHIRNKVKYAARDNFVAEGLGDPTAVAKLRTIAKEEAHAIAEKYVVDKTNAAGYGKIAGRLLDPDLISNAIKVRVENSKK